MMVVACFNQQGGMHSHWLHLLAGTDPLELRSQLPSASPSDAHPLICSLRGRPALQEHAGIWGMVPAASGGGSDPGSVRPSTSGSVCVGEKHRVRAFLLPTKWGHAPFHRCFSTWLAAHAALCFPLPGPDCSHSVPRARKNGHSLILIAPHWPAMHWLAEMYQQLRDQPWPLSLRRDVVTGRRLSLLLWAWSQGR